MNLKKYILGELLFLANSNPPWWRNEFYLIKDKVLTSCADIEGHHLQHIFKECFRCEGTGKEPKQVRVLGELITMRTRCSKCNGSGKFDEFWTVLTIYRLGRRQFHKPIGKYWSQKDLPHLIFLENIEGYIRHERPKYYLYDEAAYWLALLFDRKQFFKRFGHAGHSSRMFTPLVILGTWFFEIRSLFHRLGYRINKLKKKLVEFRQDLCRHEFQKYHTPSVWDECKHCGIKRIYANNGRDEIPF